MSLATAPSVAPSVSIATLQQTRCHMSQPLTAEYTTFTLDTMGRFLANTLQEALDSSSQSVGDFSRDFDVIVVGGGSFGSIVAERLLLNDTTHCRRILVLEAGPFVLPEHWQ